MRNFYTPYSLRGLWQAVLCLIGLHEWRYRIKGGIFERVCMRHGCTCHQRRPKPIHATHAARRIAE